MAAANFSRDVLKMFYGSISNEENQRLRPPIRPRRRLDFEIVRNNFISMAPCLENEGPRRQQRHLEFFPKDEKPVHRRLQG